MYSTVNIMLCYGKNGRVNGLMFVYLKIIIVTCTPEFYIHVSDCKYYVMLFYGKNGKFNGLLFVYLKIIIVTCTPEFYIHVFDYQYYVM